MTGRDEALLLLLDQARSRLSEGTPAGKVDAMEIISDVTAELRGEAQ